MPNMDQRPPLIRHRWFAAAYELMSRVEGKQMRSYRQRVAGGATGRVLELGCGTGLNFEHYDWSRVEIIEATEPDPYMLRRAQARRDALPEAVKAKIKLTSAAAERLPFPDESFDSAVVTLVLCTVTDTRRSLAELRRVLKQAGEVRLIEHVRAPGFKGRLQRVIQPLYGWTAAGCQLHRDTERNLVVAGFGLEVIDRPDLGPLWPAFVGIAKLRSTT